jgi:hypothetical protein
MDGWIDGWMYGWKAWFKGLLSAVQKSEIARSIKHFFWICLRDLFY